MGRHVDLASTRKEATRRQRIEAEQKRRDELRDGYAKLKDVLPVSNQKSSKVNLLERGMLFLPFLLPIYNLPRSSDLAYRPTRNREPETRKAHGGAARRYRAFAISE